MARFYEALEGVLKRHHPVEYILSMAVRLRECRHDARKWRHTPPFRAVHSVEACCAYARSQNQDRVTLDRIFKAMNVYHGHSDPMQDDALASSVPHFILLMYREQMELQHSHSWDDFGRILTLYGQPESLPRTTKTFEQRYHLTPFQWIRLCFLAATAAENSPLGLFLTDAILDYLRKSTLPDQIPEEAVRSFLALSSLTPGQVGKRFHEERAKLPPYLHGLIRSALLDTPLINLGRDVYGREHMVLLIRDLMFRHCGEGLYRLMKPMDTFGREIGDAFEGYVGQVLGCFEDRVALHGESQLEPFATGESCDYLLELPSEILLVETKGVSFTKTSLTEKSIQEDTSTRQVAKGVRQLYATAHDLHAGRFNHLGIDTSKPLLGIVVTLSEIPLVNMDWYFDSFIMKMASPKLESPVYPSPNLLRRPVSMSVRTLEQLVILGNSLGDTPLALHTKKALLPDAMVGEWDTYLSQLVRENRPAIKGLPFMRPQTANMMLSLGVPEEDVENMIIRRNEEA